MIEFLYKYEPAIRLAAFLGGFSLLSLWELASPKRVLSEKKTRRWFNNFVLVICSSVIVRLLISMTPIAMAYTVQQQHWGLSYLLNTSTWLVAVITFVLLDFTIYLQHALFHALPLLWRFHRVHHSDLDCDVSTGLRFHPVEILISILFKLITIITFGIPVITVVLFEIVLNLMSMFTHSNIKLNTSFERAMRWFFVTPDMHRMHHSSDENETNSNFSFNFSFWDRLLGTYMQEPKKGQLGMTIGLDHFRQNNQQKLSSLLHMPFIKNIDGYAINHRDIISAEELAFAKHTAKLHKEKAKLSAQLSSYLDAIGEHAMVSVTDAEGTITHVNKLFCQISGYSEFDLIGKNHRILNSETHTHDFFDHMWRKISSKKPWRGEICNRNKDGDLLWMDTAISPIINLDGSIHSYIAVRLDITDRIRHEKILNDAYEKLAIANKKLDKVSRTDQLTQISNRRHFDEILASKINDASRANTSITLILCDIDNFKLYNDTYGHQEGDNCLQQIAASIKTSFVRQSDLTARYGGEEFAIILSGVDRDIAFALTEKMRTNVESLELYLKPETRTNRITISSGVITTTPTKNTTPESLIKLADDALYEAKSMGKNKVIYAK